MTIAALREHIHKAVDNADEKILESVYALLEEHAVEQYEWSEDEEFVAELDERWRRYETGIDKAHTWQELEDSIADLKKNRESNG